LISKFKTNLLRKALKKSYKIILFLLKLYSRFEYSQIKGKAIPVEAGEALWVPGS